MRVKSRQASSKMCFICGLENPIGLRLPFYNMEDGSVMTKFQYKEEHQSFPQRVHGGLIGTLLDELAFRAYWVKDESMFGVTMSMETKFRKPVPYCEDIIGKGYIVKDMSKFYVAEVSLSDIEGNVLANGTVKYIKMPFNKIADADVHKQVLLRATDNVSEI